MDTELKSSGNKLHLTKIVLQLRWSGSRPSCCARFSCVGVPAPAQLERGRPGTEANVPSGYHLIAGYVLAARPDRSCVESLLRPTVSPNGYYQGRHRRFFTGTA